MRIILRSAVSYWGLRGGLTRLAKPDFFNSQNAARDALQTPRQRKMILTNCAACAAPLAHNAPRCVRCWTRYCDATCQLGRPEADMARQMAMNVLGLGLSEARHDEDALAVQEAELATMRRLGADEEGILITRGNIASSSARAFWPSSPLMGLAPTTWPTPTPRR